jgi:hypothetical protein
MERVQLGYFFDQAEGNTRGHELKLVKPKSHLYCRKYSFSNRVINEWNQLPGDVITCGTVAGFKGTVAGFKRKIDHYLFSQGFI